MWKPYIRHKYSFYFFGKYKIQIAITSLPHKLSLLCKLATKEGNFYPYLFINFH